MEIEDFADYFTESLGEEKVKVLLKFLIVFSRFECALKATISFAKIRWQPIEPYWEKFIQENEKPYQETDKESIRNSIDYILKNPPKIQVFDQLKSKIIWVINDKIKEEQTELYKIVNHIKTVRNNLFHGGKFEFIVYDSVGVEEISRNNELIEHSIKILEMLIGFNSDVRKAYTESI